MCITSTEGINCKKCNLTKFLWHFQKDCYSFHFYHYMLAGNSKIKCYFLTNNNPIFPFKSGQKLLHSIRITVQTDTFQHACIQQTIDCFYSTYLTPCVAWYRRSVRRWWNDHRSYRSTYSNAHFASERNAVYFFPDPGNYFICSTWYSPTHYCFRTDHQTPVEARRDIECIFQPTLVVELFALHRFSTHRLDHDSDVPDQRSRVITRDLHFLGTVDCVGDGSWWRIN